MEAVLSERIFSAGPACLLLLVAGVGCRIASPQKALLPTQSDRLIQAYPELAGGRFAVIADFEHPNHQELFQLAAASAEARQVLSTDQGIPATGRTCLAFTAGSPDDALVINNESASHWYLKRDWRAYDLLLLNIHAPNPRRPAARENLTLALTIAAGLAAPSSAVQSFIPLTPGWNTLRVDLGEVGERIPLDEVRELRLSVSGAAKPVELCLDDLVLTGYRRDAFGDSANRDGALYVQRAGRRWNIGAGGRFELTFANGQIVRWYNLASDPYRLRNFVHGTVLGPNLMALGRTDSDPGVPAEADSDFAMLGKAVVAQDRLLETNSVRVVVACEWRFIDDPAAPSSDRPWQRWIYTIYPTGQVYVSVDQDAGSRASSLAPLGLAVIVASDGADRLDLQQAADAADGAAPLPSFGTVTNVPSDFSLLYVLGRHNNGVTLTEAMDGRHGRRSIVARAAGAKGLELPASWVCQLRLGAAGELGDQPEVLARAAAYVSPPELQFDLGSLAENTRLGHVVNGFDQATGCYAITADRGRVRFFIDGRQQPSFSPAFRVRDGAGQQAWVYINQALLTQVTRDSTGDLLFQLPGAIRNRTLVEVLFRSEP